MIIKPEYINKEIKGETVTEAMIPTGEKAPVHITETGAVKACAPEPAPKGSEIQSGNLEEKIKLKISPERRIPASAL